MMSITSFVRVFDIILKLSFALLPSVAIAYFIFFENATLRFEAHTFHQVAVCVATLLSLGISVVTWKCYQESGERMLGYLWMGFFVSAVVYSFHGLFTQISDTNPVAFLIHGPFSRVVLGIFFLTGLLALEREKLWIERVVGWSSGFVYALTISAALAAIAFGPFLTERFSSPFPEFCETEPSRFDAVRLTAELMAILLFLASVVTISIKHRNNPLLTLSAIGLIYFVQADICFILSKPWTHAWWLAHFIFASGFLLISWGILQIYGTTNSIRDVFGLSVLLAKVQDANQQLDHMASHDVLTGLHNRMELNKRLQEEFQRMKRTGEIFSVLMADVDHFKSVNDTYGHETGDKALQLVANGISSSLRLTDFAARFGGEEFLVILPATNEEGALILAEKIRCVISSINQSNTPHLTVSIGVATASMDDDSVDIVVSLADLALYDAKGHGRNQVCASKREPQ